MWIGAGLVSMSAVSTHTLLAHADESTATAWTIDTGKSRLVVHVYKKGLLSGFAHDHHFVPKAWRAEAMIDIARPERAQVRLWVEAASLSDDQPDLSDDDRQKVERQASGPDILDASQYPQIRFDAVRFEPAPKKESEPGVLRGTLIGSLTLHGTTRPLRVVVAARVTRDELRVNGAVTFAQSDFGIRPYSTALGTIAVQDRVRVEFALVARQRR